MLTVETGRTEVLEDCVAIVVIGDSGIFVLIVALGVTGNTGVLEDCAASVAGGDFELPGIFVLTVVSVTVDSGVAGDSVLTEVSVVDENFVLL